MTAGDLTPITLDPTLDAWERQPGETPKRYAQFCGYRDAGRTRTLRKVAEILTLSAGYVRQVAAAGRWVERAEAFDRHRDHLHEVEWLEQRRQAATADARLLSAVTGKIVGRLQSLQPDQLSTGDLIRLLDVVMRHRRTLFGDPALTVAVTGPGGDPLTVHLAGFAAMPAEQRRIAVAGLAAAATRRSEAAAGVDDDDD